ncbi:MFS transporter [Phormidium tenue FACHB-886]|nr:MFS transporter [Phormidium tenue FACHB-886]
MRTKFLLLAIAYLSFVSLGLPDAAIGVAWTSIRETFGLPQSGLGVVLVSGGVGYFTSGFFAGQLVQRLGVGSLLALSSAGVTIGLVGYALTPVWLLFAGCALLIGAGSGAIDAGLNTYAASHFSAKQLNWLHACYGIGITLGSLIMTGVLAKYGSWRWGYGSIASLIFLMALTFTFTRTFWQQNSGASAAAQDPSRSTVGLLPTLQQPLVWLQLIVFFVYTGVEATAGQWSFTLYSEARSIPLETAGTWVGLYWGSLTVGRVLFGFIVPKLGADRLLRFSTLGVLLGSLLYSIGAVPLSVFGLAIIGLSLAPIFPCLMSRTPARLGRYATNAIGFQVSAAMLGGAIVPSVTGLLVTAFSLEVIRAVVLIMAIALWSFHEILIRYGATHLD